MVLGYDLTGNLWPLVGTVTLYALPFLALAVGLTLLDKLVRLVFGWPLTDEDEGAAGGGDGLPPPPPPPQRPPKQPKVTEGAETPLGSGDAATESSYAAGWGEESQAAGSGDSADTTTRTHTWS